MAWYSHLRPDDSGRYFDHPSRGGTAKLSPMAQVKATSPDIVLLSDAVLANDVPDRVTVRHLWIASTIRVKMETMPAKQHMNKNHTIAMLL